VWWERTAGDAGSDDDDIDALRAHGSLLSEPAGHRL
jgi:hypothetical protein